MKKIISLIMVCIISFSLVSCSKKIDIPSKPDAISEVIWLKGIAALKMIDSNISNKKLFNKNETNDVDDFMIYYGKNLVDTNDEETEFCEGILSIMTEYVYYNEYSRIDEKKQANEKSELIYTKIKELYKKYN